MKTMFDSDGNISKWHQINNQAVQLMNQGYFDEAQQFANEALKLALKINKLELIANSYSNLGFLAYQKKDFDTAESLYLEALKINSEHDGSKSLTVAMVLCNLALLKYSEGLYDQAISHYKTAIEIKAAKLAPHHHSLIKSVQNLAAIYDFLGRKKEVKESCHCFKIVRKEIHFTI